ncbi:STRN4 protein, partial [Jacana jacana]|nr:STRN4 protein [Jacana jacana]
DPGVLSSVLEGHGDAVWGLAFNPAGDRLASCSADGTLRIWDPRRWLGPSWCLRPVQVAVSEPQGCGGVCVSPPSPCHHSPAGNPHPGVPQAGGSQVNQVVSHPSQPLTITASDDRGIRFLDNRTAAHLCPEGVRSQPEAPVCRPPPLSPDFLCHLPGHDCSLRLWHLAHKTCVQELTAHRKKHEEAVHAVAFHPSRALSASAGADALAKVFV